MSRVATHIARVKPERLVAKGQLVLSSMRGNPYFPDPILGLDELAVLVESCQWWVLEVEKATKALRLAVARRNAVAAQLRRGLEMQSLYVQQVSDGNPVVILSSGLDLVAERRPIQMQKVEGLRVQPSEFAGALVARWRRQKGVRTYELQISLEDGEAPREWIDKARSRKIRCVLSGGLRSGQRIWVRVRAFGANGVGPWSDPVLKTVP